MVQEKHTTYTHTYTQPRLFLAPTEYTKLGYLLDLIEGVHFKRIDMGHFCTCLEKPRP